MKFKFCFTLIFLFVFFKNTSPLISQTTTSPAASIAWEIFFNAVNVWDYPELCAEYGFEITNDQMKGQSVDGQTEILVIYDGTSGTLYLRHYEWIYIGYFLAQEETQPYSISPIKWKIISSAVTQKEVPFGLYQNSVLRYLGFASNQVDMQFLRN